MVMTDDVVPIVWPKDHWHKMLVQILCCLFSSFTAPLLSRLSDLAHTNRDLGRMQLFDRSVLEQGFVNDAHHRSLIAIC